MMHLVWKKENHVVHYSGIGFQFRVLQTTTAMSHKRLFDLPIVSRLVGNAVIGKVCDNPCTPVTVV